MLREFGGDVSYVVGLRVATELAGVREAAESELGPDRSAVFVTPRVVFSSLNLACLLWRHRGVAGSLLPLQQLGSPALLDAAGNRFATVDFDWAVTLHRFDDGALGVLPTSELKLLEDVWIYGHLDSHGSENAIGASEATAGRLIWSVTRFLSNCDGTVIEAVTAEVEDEDF